MNHIQVGLDTLHVGNELIELRCILPDGRWWGGLFNDREKIISTLQALNEIEAAACYWSLNQISPLLLPTNKLLPVAKNSCVKNADVVRVRWLFLDIDNKGSIEAVEQLANDVAAYIAKLGEFAPPVRMNSGTGRYLLYPADGMPPKAVRTMVKTLADSFDREGAIIDQKCWNPARIARIPGTWNRKGTPRMAQIC